jgi:glc operon protein GlcG
LFFGLAISNLNLAQDLIEVIRTMASGAGASAQLMDKKTLTLAAAKKMADAAQAEAEKYNWPLVIAIVDAGGDLIVLHRMDTAQLGSIEIAQAKARTSLRYRRPSKAFADSLNSGNTHILKLPGVFPSGGGLPVELDGFLVGAIGISGATSEEDEQCARTAIASLGEK